MPQPWIFCIINECTGYIVAENSSLLLLFKCPSIMQTDRPEETVKEQFDLGHHCLP